MMKTDDLIRSTFPFLEKDLLEELINISEPVSLDTGQSIVSEGEYIKSFPIILTGCLRVSRLSAEGNELLLYYLNQGDICTMLLTCCMGLQKSAIKMHAEEPSIVLRVPVGKPEGWMSEYRTWKEFMIYSYRKRFGELLDTIDSLAFMKLDERVVRFFEERYRSTGKTFFSGTHQDIASQLNSSREVISRILGNLEKKDLITTGRNSIDYSVLIKKSFPV